MLLSAPEYLSKTSIQLSGSKSISNRLLILNQVLDLNLNFHNLSDSEDTFLLQKALMHLRNKKKETINVQHAGTDMRFLTAYLSVTEGEWTLTGSDRMKQRPIGELVNALKMLGAEISYLEKEGFPPLFINGKNLKGGSIEIDSSVSSQFISALLLISAFFENGLELKLKGTTVSRPYIQMTVELLKKFGVTITESPNLITVLPSVIFPVPSDSYRDGIQIESDWSSASYWYSLCALSGNAKIELDHFDEESLQADSILPVLYKDLGVQTTFNENCITLRSIEARISEFNYDFTNCPDIAQTIAVSCFGLGIKADLRGLSTLKVKETDRLLALKTELEKFGANVEITSSTLSIRPFKHEILNKNPVMVNTYNDHRMAMSFAPLALLYKNIKIDNPSVVDKSYPGFWEDLKSVGFNVNLHA